MKETSKPICSVQHLVRRGLLLRLETLSFTTGNLWVCQTLGEG